MYSYADFDVFTISWNNHRRRNILYLSRMQERVGEIKDKKLRFLFSSELEIENEYIVDVI